jgi:hypothetical protein
MQTQIEFYPTEAWNPGRMEPGSMTLFEKCDCKPQDPLDPHGGIVICPLCGTQQHVTRRGLLGIIPFVCCEKFCPVQFLIPDIGEGFFQQKLPLVLQKVF